MTDQLQNNSFLDGIEFDQSEIKPERTRKAVEYKKATPKSSANPKKNGYRPVLVSKESLASEAIQLATQMKLLRQLHSTQYVSNQDIAALYILMYLDLRHPDIFLENFNPILNALDQAQHSLVKNSAPLSDYLPLKNTSFNAKLAKYKSRTLFEIVNNFNLHSVPYSARFAIANW